MNIKGVIVKSVFAVFLFCCVSCDPSDKELYQDVDYYSLRYVINDNKSISTFNALVNLTPYRERFATNEKFIIIAPSDAAFRRARLNRDNMFANGSEYINQLISSHVLSDYLNLEDLPYMNSQRLYTASGLTLTANKWLRDGQSYITINGVLLDSVAQVGSNGKVYILDQLLPIKDYPTVLDALRDRAEFSLFTRAVQYGGLEEELRTLPMCTIYAPSNAAMSNFGYGSFQLIENTSEDMLKEFVYNHIQLDQVFVNNLGFMINLDEEGEYPMDSFSSATINEYNRIGRKGISQTQNYANNLMALEYAEASPGGNFAFRFQILDASTKVAKVSPLNKDLSCRNGVVHQIDKVLTF